MKGITRAGIHFCQLLFFKLTQRPTNSRLIFDVLPDYQAYMSYWIDQMLHFSCPVYLVKIVVQAVTPFLALRLCPGI